MSSGPPIHPRGLFVTGTDTEVGKTFLAGAVLAALAARGQRVAPYKPVVTGLGGPQPDRPTDPELLAAAAGVPDDDAVATYRFGPAVSPHLAADEHGVRIDCELLADRARRAGEGRDALIVEGAGGLMVPLAGVTLMRDLMVALGLPLLIAARPGLGTINHTLLTIEAARSVHLQVRAVVLTPWPEHSTAMQRSNRETIARLADVEVVTLARAAHPTAEALAEIGRTLPLDRWLP